MAKQKKSGQVFSERTITKRPAGSNVILEPAWGFEYTTQAGPCPSLRSSCPVQLFYKKGRPTLRFCRVQPNRKKKLKPGEKPKFSKKEHAPTQKGFTVEVDSADDAQRIAAAACRCWKKSADGFAQVVEKAKGKPSSVWRGSFETCSIGPHKPGTAPLGRTRRRRRRKK